MSQRTLLKCDKCGFEREKKTAYAEEEKEIQFYSMGVFRCKGSYLHLDYNSIKISQEVQWCQKCCEESKVFPPLVEARDLPKPAPTFEELLREMVAQEVFDQSQQ